MKKTLALVMVLLMTLTLFVGCEDTGTGSASESTTTAGDASADTTGESSEGKSYTFAVSLNNTDQYRTTWLEKFKALAEGQGHTVFETNANNDASKQVSDVEALIENNPDVIIIHPLNSEGIVPAIEACDSAGIPVVTIDQPSASDLITTHIMDSQGENGVIQAQYVQAWLDQDSSRKANIGYIVGDYSMEAAMPRRDDFFSTLGMEKGMAEADAGWSADTAMGITEDWLQAYPDMNVFACMSDEIAIGCIQALKAANVDMEEVLVLGVDGSDQAMEYLESGDLDATAARNVDIEVEFALESAEKIAAGETVEKEQAPHAIYALTKDDV